MSKGKKERYFVKRGYFGHLGRVYISIFKAWMYRAFTDIVVYKETEGGDWCLNFKEFNPKAR